MSGKSGKKKKINEMDKSSSDELTTCTQPELSKPASNARHDLLPSRSKSIYESAYTAFTIWRKKNKSSSSFESELMEYFVELSKKYKPSTLWSIYSMLKSTINLKESIDIGAYPDLTAYLKKQSTGFQSKKSNVLSSTEIQRFLTEAPDNKYLIIKVALIFGICGACRSNELVNIRLQDITKHGKLIVVNLPVTRTKRPRTFVISEEFTDTILKYEALRPARQIGDRFFLNYQNGKCTAQVIGVHKFSKMPGQIATFLNLPNAETYTGHAFRRTSATLLADSGANIITLKRHGEWKSSSVAEGYNQESIQNEPKISNLLSSSIRDLPTLSTSTTSATSPIPSTSSISATSLLPSEVRGNSDEIPPFKQRRMNKAARGASSTITTSPNETTIFNNCSALEEDAANWMKYRMMGGRIKLKSGILPKTKKIDNKDPLMPDGPCEAERKIDEGNNRLLSDNEQSCDTDGHAVYFKEELFSDDVKSEPEESVVEETFFQAVPDIKLEPFDCLENEVEDPFSDVLSKDDTRSSDRSFSHKDIQCNINVRKRVRSKATQVDINLLTCSRGTSPIIFEDEKEDIDLR